MVASANRLYLARPLFARPVRVASCLFSTTATPVVAPGVNESQAIDELRLLLKAGWALDERRCGIEKAYYFKTYTKCQDFFNTVAIRSKAKNHHSTMTIKAGSVHVHWTTHHPRGLTLLDTVMARYCDEQSASIGTVDQSQSKKCHPALA
ncbi:pterin-4-alpha-carbinolamine dehydratase [Nannizzia gypsea CBS 118893]|uniref:4a-hydroxytetrahydrobiopterin dehydratase n=1 Tax=Arthroderma gypseum (strain ATCC MYA-4604 / CBS 118893) TaxID=535722 RepID=E4V739_ARTGP|nr:pterin-4-alpha-carbinolamine dehydratase [Nannizzia gypsea CBS 118893]EFQ96905.1 pterin-4-alpha-carbinolamine dehydratase [Nannizzia gypsea CBS 118893]